MRVLVSAALSLSLSLTSACLLERAALAQEQPPEKPAPAAARPADPDAVEYDCTVDPNVPIDADKLLQVWAERLKLPLVLDPQIAGTKVRFAQSDLKLTWGLVRSVLDFHDIVVEEKDVSGRRVLFAHLRRNLNGQLAPPFRVVGDQEPLGRGDEVVAAFIQVRNGAANDIFATVRGLLVRDLNRVGNILYVKGPEIIIVVDFAANVDYYRKVVAALDLPAPPRVVKTISLVHGAAEDVAKELRELAS